MYCLMHEGLILLVSTTSNVTVESMMHAAVEWVHEQSDMRGLIPQKWKESILLVVFNFLHWPIIRYFVIRIDHFIEYTCLSL